MFTSSQLAEVSWHHVWVLSVWTVDGAVIILQAAPTLTRCSGHFHSLHLPVPCMLNTRNTAGSYCLPLYTVTLLLVFVQHVTEEQTVGESREKHRTQIIFKHACSLDSRWAFCLSSASMFPVSWVLKTSRLRPQKARRIRVWEPCSLFPVRERIHLMLSTVWQKAALI